MMHSPSIPKTKSRPTWQRTLGTIQGAQKGPTLIFVGGINTFPISAETLLHWPVT